MPNRHNIELFGIGLLIFSSQICFNKKVLEKSMLKTNKFFEMLKKSNFSSFYRTTIKKLIFF